MPARQRFCECESHGSSPPARQTNTRARRARGAGVTQSRGRMATLNCIARLNLSAGWISSDTSNSPTFSA
jgi:hypothetical protein